MQTYKHPDPSSALRAFNSLYTPSASLLPRLAGEGNPPEGENKYGAFAYEGLLIRACNGAPAPVPDGFPSGSTLTTNNN